VLWLRLELEIKSLGACGPCCKSNNNRYNFLQINFSRIIVFVHYGPLHKYLSVSILIQGYGPLFATHVYFPIGYLHIFFNLIIEDTYSNFFTNIMEKVVHSKVMGPWYEVKEV